MCAKFVSLCDTKAAAGFKIPLWQHSVGSSPTSGIGCVEAIIISRRTRPDLCPCRKTSHSLDHPCDSTAVSSFAPKPGPPSVPPVAFLEEFRASRNRPKMPAFHKHTTFSPGNCRVYIFRNIVVIYIKSFLQAVRRAPPITLSGELPQTSRAFRCFSPHALGEVPQ